MGSFLDNLKKSLEDEKPNDDVVNHLNEIDKKASTMDEKSAQDALDKRIKAAGEKPELTQKEREELEKEYVKFQKEEEELNKKLARLAYIESLNDEIRKLKEDFQEIKEKYTKTIQKEDFQEIKEKYTKTIQEVHDNKIKLMADFESIYGTKAEDEYNFGSEPSTKLD